VQLLPATSLAFEEPEADIMYRAPRDLTKDKLVAPPLLIYAYLIAGMFETMACFMVYFEVGRGRRGEGESRARKYS